jgi:Zn-dependent M28 family amino/carboxypeptidase
MLDCDWSSDVCSSDLSEALAHTAKYILEQLRAASLQAEEQVFTTNTPRGPIAFRNIIARTRPGCPPRLIVGGHYDTKWMPRMRFVGANDGGSSTAALLEIARVLAGQPVDAWLVWFDGEECVVKYDEKDGFYGSTHLVRKLFQQKMLRQIQAAVVLDMVGDKRLHLTIPDTDRRGTPLLQHVFAAASSLGLRDYIGLMGHSMFDDHMPFVWNGVPAIDLIDFDYGNIPSQNNFWHTERDSLENCSPESLRITGQITLELLRRLAFEKWPKS